MIASVILGHLTSMSPQRTADLPRDAVGIYGLIDHTGCLSHIGSTSSSAENFCKRIHQRHRTGSETHSHYFSKAYNSCRMWRHPKLDRGNADTKVANDLRSAFIAEYCRAVWFAMDADKPKIERIEKAVIAAAPPEYRRWNANTDIRYSEPESLVDALMKKLCFSRNQRAAVERQQERFLRSGVFPA